MVCRSHQKGCHLLVAWPNNTETVSGRGKLRSRRARRSHYGCSRLLLQVISCLTEPFAGPIGIPVRRNEDVRRLRLDTGTI